MSLTVLAAPLPPPCLPGDAGGSVRSGVLFAADQSRRAEPATEKRAGGQPLRHEAARAANGYLLASRYHPRKDRWPGFLPGNPPVPLVIAAAHDDHEGPLPPAGGCHD